VFPFTLLCERQKSLYFYMMKTVQSIFETLEARRKELGLSQAEVGRRALGQSDGSALQNMKRGSAPSPENLEKICAVLNLDFYIGPHRTAGPVEHTIVDGDDFAKIPRLDVRLSAGNGAQNGHPEVIETLAFRHDWLKRLDLSASSAVLVGIDGDSMAPDLHHGDLALIDQNRAAVRSGHVYAFTDIDGSTRVKRLDLLPDQGYILRSDNPKFPTETRLGPDANRVNILGQVVWSGHTWPSR
jgi:phage repressor protein C with HTH and peptisase S24 domain